jgi:hypothetical protein
MESLEDAEVQRLLGLLDQAIHDTRRSRRDIERSLGLGQGYLGSLFRGRIELKVWHVYRLARELKRDPLSFFFAVSPPQDPRWVLKALGYDPDSVLGPADRSGALAARPAPDYRPDDGGWITSEQIEEIVRRSIRDELKRRGIGDPDED